MNKKIEDAVKRYGMEKMLDGVVLGYSGGADSSALLHYLKDRCTNLVAVHVNHMIRGAEADRDEELCRRTCFSYGVRFVSFRVDVPALARERKQGLEETAREERYRIFNEVLAENPECQCIVTAHNSNDNAETVIFNLTRGSGSGGLGGIKPVQGKIVRPLIYSSRDEILRYCLDNNIEYVTDSTNNDTAYTRNRIRHKVLPELLEINPGFLDSCHRLGDILRRDDEYILGRAQELVALTKNGVIPKESVVSLDSAVLARVLRACAGTNIGYTGISDCMRLIERWETGKMVNLEGGITFKIEHSYCSFIKTEETRPCSFSQPLTHGINIIGNTGIAVCINCAVNKSGYAETGRVRLDSSKLKGALYVRNKQEGDRVISLGHTKKLKRVLSDRHIPFHIRSTLPVICDEAGIVAIPGIIARDGAFAKNGDLEIITYSGGINEKKEE